MRKTKTEKQTKQRANRLKKTAKRLAAYSAAAAATVMATQDRAADAADILWDIPDVSVGSPPGLLFNMVTGAATMATATSSNATPGSMRLIGNYNTGAYTSAYIYTPAGDITGAFVGSGSNATFLAFGEVIDGNDTFGYATYGAGPGNYANLGNWSDGVTGFVGIQFDLGGSTHYGWAEITRDTTALTATLHSFGYNDTPGEGATAGVPEPSGMALLAAGAAGLGMLRRRRSGQAG